MGTEPEKRWVHEMGRQDGEGSQHGGEALGSPAEASGPCPVSGVEPPWGCFSNRRCDHAGLNSVSFSCLGEPKGQHLEEHVRKLKGLGQEANRKGQEEGRPWNPTKAAGPLCTEEPGRVSPPDHSPPHPVCPALSREPAPGGFSKGWPEGNSKYKVLNILQGESYHK